MVDDEVVREMPRKDRDMIVEFTESEPCERGGWLWSHPPQKPPGLRPPENLELGLARNEVNLLNDLLDDTPHQFSTCSIYFTLISITSPLYVSMIVIL